MKQLAPAFADRFVARAAQHGRQQDLQAGLSHGLQYAGTPAIICLLLSSKILGEPDAWSSVAAGTLLAAERVMLLHSKLYTTIKLCFMLDCGGI